MSLTSDLLRPVAPRRKAHGVRPLAGVGSDPSMHLAAIVWALVVCSAASFGASPSFTVAVSPHQGSTLHAANGGGTTVVVTVTATDASLMPVVNLAGIADPLNKCLRLTTPQAYCLNGFCGWYTLGLSISSGNPVSRTYVVQLPAACGNSYTPENYTLRLYFSDSSSVHQYYSYTYMVRYNHPASLTSAPTAAHALVRASRRGQGSSSPFPGFSSTAAPGAWDQVYDTGRDVSRFGSWAYISVSVGTTPGPSFYNSSALPLGGASGAPVSLVAPILPGSSQWGYYSCAQVADPVSPPTPVDVAISSTGVPYDPSDPHYASFISVAGVSGPSSVANPAYASSAPASWPVFAGTGWGGSGGGYESSSTVSNLQPAPSWSRLPNYSSGSPQPCAGPGTNCDTDQATISSTVYGPNPDQYTPYTVLSRASDTWCVVGAKVSDTTGSPAPAVPVAASSEAGLFQPTEKVTDASGHFAILLPNCGPSDLINFVINSSAPVTGVADLSHYYDPHYVTLSTGGHHFTPSFSGQYFDNISGNVSGGFALSIASYANPGGAPSQKGFVYGLITASENSQPLNGVPVQLRNSQGYLLESVVTGPTSTIKGSPANYQFEWISGTQGNLAAGNYYVVPVADRHETVLPALPQKAPPQQQVAVPPGDGLQDNFQVQGAPALVKVQSGSAGVYALVYSTSSTAGVGSTQPAGILSPTLNNQIYAALLNLNQGGAAPPYYQNVYVPPGQAYNVQCWNLSGGVYASSGTIAPLTSGNPGNVLYPYASSGESSHVAGCP